MKTKKNQASSSRKRAKVNELEITPDAARKNRRVEEEVTVTPPPNTQNRGGGLSEKVLNAETHQWQQPFVQVELKHMPENNKLEYSGELVVNEEVVRKGLKYAELVKMIFRVREGKKHGEENDWPRLVNLALGCCAFIKPELINVETGPVQYFNAAHIDGQEVLVETSSAVYEDNPKTLENEDGTPKSWKMDIVMSSKVYGSDDWIPRSLVEGKGDDACEVDLYQGSISGCKLLLKRLQDSLDIERLYIQVWGTTTYCHGILDILGYITIMNGRVTEQSFEKYLDQVNKRKALKSFPHDTLARLPQTREHFQVLYEDKNLEFYNKYHCYLPSKSGVEDFPVGVLYLSSKRRVMPSGRCEEDVSFDAVRHFFQAQIRILGSNAALIGDDVNERLLANFQGFEDQQKGFSHRTVSSSAATQEVLKVVTEATPNSFKLGRVDGRKRKLETG